MVLVVGALFLYALYGPTYFVTDCAAARILAAMPIPSYSHQIVFRPLWKELSRRGHHVTLLTTNPMNDSSLVNITEVDWRYAYDLWNTKHNVAEMMSNYQSNLLNVADRFVDMMSDIVDQELSHPQVQSLIRDPDTKFDLVMVEYLYPSMSVLSERFKCPFIGVVPLDALGIFHEAIGNPTNPSLYPDFMLPFSGSLSFAERLVSSAFWLWIRYFFKYKIFPRDDSIIRKHFGSNVPPMHEMHKKMSMLFINTNPVFHNVRPTVPTTINIGGGTHLQKKPAPLPTDLKMFLDNSPEGVIYFSLGTNVKSKDLPHETIREIMDAFAEMPFKVLWKFEIETCLQTPTNIRMEKWLPQQDVLKHKNIKLFITQGGLQSMEEAIYNKIPLLAIPFFGDQQANADSMVSKGLGLSLDHRGIEKGVFKAAVLEIITNKRYKDNVAEVSKLYTDHLISGLDLAVWWTEHVIKYKGVDHLRSPSVDVPFYKFHCIDVFAFLLIIGVICCYLIYLCAVNIVKYISIYQVKRVW